MVNVERLRKELEFIEGNPDKWNQEQWIADCGTYGCLAGNTVIHEGYKPYSQVNGLVVDDNLWPTPVMDTAADILKLTGEQAGALFAASNDLGCLWTLANQYSNGEIEIPIHHQDHKCINNFDCLV